MPNYNNALNFSSYTRPSGVNPSMFNPGAGAPSSMPLGLGLGSNMLGGLGNMIGNNFIPGFGQNAGPSSFFNPTAPVSQMPGILGTLSNIAGGIGNMPGNIWSSIQHLVGGTLGQHSGDSGSPFGQGDTGPTADNQFDSQGNYIGNQAAPEPGASPGGNTGDWGNAFQAIVSMLRGNAK